MTVLSMWSTLESIRHSVVSRDFVAIMDIAGLLACIGAGIAMFKVVRTYVVPQSG